ncbi:MAG: hypothetical protein KAI47_03190 [Deltaproteobacteria bacterium]|nr:hypothetical protein [Deltaproteobacteria bacterium]
MAEEVLFAIGARRMDRKVLFMMDLQPKTRLGLSRVSLGRRAAGRFFWVIVSFLVWFSWPGVIRGASDPQGTIYRYVNASGRAVFMNDLKRVPERYRATAKPVDLSQVSTNKVLGREIKESVDEEVERLTASGYCFNMRRRAEAGWFRTLWDHYGHLVLLGALVLLLIGGSPWIMARIPAPQWGRFLLFILPVLAMIAIWSTAVVETTRSLQSFRAAAVPCEPSTYRGQPKAPADRRRQIGMLGDLEAKIREMSQKRVRVLDSVLKETEPPKGPPQEVRGLP